MSNKVKHIDIKNRPHYFFNDIISKKILILIILKKMKSLLYSYLLYWICDDQR